MPISDHRLLRPPPTDPHSRLLQRIASLEDQVYQLEHGRGHLIHIDHIVGATASYSTAFTGTAAYPVLSDGTKNMTLSYTPPVDALAEVTGLIGIVQKNDAAYHYMYGGWTMSPASADGITHTLALATQRSDVTQYQHRSVSRTVELSAGTAYTFNLVLGGSSGGTWQYYRDNARLYLSIKAWAK